MANADSASCEIASFEPVEDCWFLTGPTASGKTRIALELAERIGAEIVSLDSIALYRGMDIGDGQADARAALPSATPSDRYRQSGHGIQPVTVRRGGPSGRGSDSAAQ